MERDAFERLVFGGPMPPSSLRKGATASDGLQFLRSVALRVAYLHDQLYRALPRAVTFYTERAERLESRLYDLAFPDATDLLTAAHDRLARLFALQDEFEEELDSGTVILSYAADAALREAQAEVRADDAALSAARRSFWARCAD